eukprot:gene9337-2445_t
MRTPFALLCAPPPLPCVYVSGSCSPPQRWAVEAAGGAAARVVHQPSGLCLAATALSTHAPLTLSGCAAGGAATLWSIADAPTQGRLVRPLNDTRLCLNVGGTTGRLQLYEPCGSAAANEVWTFGADGA